ncbi:dystrotelin [Sphaeramia orbicularis]|uniref:dystrotelin n=1 Tax=Sphaeramia orbicularis TaxID=375764 RepID=UPI00117D29F7|nr:dystrotelin [Sphaeramia orbicularis]
MTVIMDVDSLEGLNEVRACVYRATLKIHTLRTHLHLHVVCVRHITDALLAVGGAKQLTRQEVMLTLNRMFHSVSQEVPGHVTAEAVEQTCSLMFRLYDRSPSVASVASVASVSLLTALIGLSADGVSDKYTALLSVSMDTSGLVSRSSLRSVLQDLAQVPVAVQEHAVFGDVEEAVKSCFKGVLTPSVTREHVMSWLQAEPRLLLWLPTLYRLSVSQNVSHPVRCHACKTRPMTGLRYRCLQCVNVHLCQSCFLTEKQTKKHKTHHPVMEFCTQPTWRESLSSLAHSARHALLPRRYTQREANKRRGHLRVEPGDSESSAPPTSDRCDADISHDACVSKALQTEDPPVDQSETLMTEVQNLHRDKWLLEQQVHAWRLAVQSEQGVLEDRCSEMEVTMETLRQHNLRLQSMLTQALQKMEAQHDRTDGHHGNPSTDTRGDAEDEQRFHRDHKTTMTEDEEEEEKGNHGDHRCNTTGEEEEEEEPFCSEFGAETPSPTILCSSPLSHDLHVGHYEEPADDGCLCPPMGQRDTPEEAEPRGEPVTSPPKEEEHDGKCSEEELLQETIERLKVTMETNRRMQTGDRKWAELLGAADEVGHRLHQLVEALRSNTQDPITKGLY